MEYPNIKASDGQERMRSVAVVVAVILLHRLNVCGPMPVCRRITVVAVAPQPHISTCREEEEGKEEDAEDRGGIVVVGCVWEAEPEYTLDILRPT